MKNSFNASMSNTKRESQQQKHFSCTAKLLIVVFASLIVVSDSLFVSSFFPTNINASFVQRNFPHSTPSFSSSDILNMSLKAWTCHGRSQRDMVEKLTMAGIVKSTPIKEALSRVDRANYVLNPANAYMDAPQPIGYSQTISAPHMHSHALEEMLPSLTKISRKLQQTQMTTTTMTNKKEDDSKNVGFNDGAELRILDVGCGSGYLSAALGRLVDRGSKGPVHPLVKGRVWGIDVVPELITLSRNNIMKADADLIKSGTVTIALGDGWDGLPSEGPFHAIHVGAAAETFPTRLMMQLYPEGGVMVIPVGLENGIQSLYKIERLRDNDQFDKKDFSFKQLLGVRYVPLVQTKFP